LPVVNPILKPVLIDNVELYDFSVGLTIP
jgi:hypothetical protein